MLYRNGRPIRDMGERHLFLDRNHILRYGGEEFIKLEEPYDQTQEMSQTTPGLWRSLISSIWWPILTSIIFICLSLYVCARLETLEAFEDHAKPENGCALGKDSVLAWGQSGCSDSAMYGPFDSHIRRQPGSYLSIEDLIIDWRKLQNRTIIVRGSIKCDDKDYCHFVTPSRLGATVVVDIENLSLERRRHIILECQDTPCEMDVTGTVDIQDFMAEEALDVTAHPAIHAVL